jgi:hypothetical protein
MRLLLLLLLLLLRTRGPVRVRGGHDAVGLVRVLLKRL